VSEIAVSNRVVARSRMGQFIRDCEQAAEATAKDLVKEGASLSRRMAPVGTRHDRRSIPIRQSIDWKMLSRTSGVWFSTAAHALHQEFGTGPHPIIGNPFMHFFWENEGRWWMPGLLGEPDIINHPGHGPQPFLRPAYERISAKAMRVARRHYPG